MMKAFYDSLDTLQKVQFATKKDYINLGIGVLIAIVVFGAFFIGVDTIWSGLYKSLYGSMRSEISIEQSLESVHGDGAVSGSLLDGVEIETTDGVQTLEQDGVLIEESQA